MWGFTRGPQSYRDAKVMNQRSCLENKAAAGVVGRMLFSFHCPEFSLLLGIVVKKLR
jgi:hypothetical protein